MSPTSIQNLIAVDVENLNEDQIDQLFTDISDFVVQGAENKDDVCKLFTVTQTIMQAKGLQADIALEELDKMATNAGKMSAKREKELLDEINDLQQHLQDYKDNSPGPSTSNDKSKSGAAYFKEEIRELKQQNEQLLNEIASKEQDMLHEKNESERYMARCDDLEKQKRDQHREINQLKDDILNMNEQLKMQANTGDYDADKEQDQVKKINDKNKQIHELINDIDELEDEKTVLVKEITNLKEKLKDAAQQMDRTTNEYLNMKEVVKEADLTIKNLMHENEILSMENKSRGQNEDSSSIDDEIMKALNERIEQWKAIITEKDAEITDQDAVIGNLKEKLAASSVDVDRASVAMLSKALKERDQQINLLKEQLEIASSDIETNVREIDNLKKELTSDSNFSYKQQRGGDEMELELRESRVKLQNAEMKMREAEDDAASRDKELAEITSRMRQYEMGEYGLAEAVGEIKDYKKQIGLRNRKIEELTQIANQSELHLNELMEENENLREKLGLDPKSPTNWKTVDGQGLAQYTTKIQKERALIHVLQQENIKLEEERIEMKMKMRKVAQLAGQRAGAIGLSVDDLQQINEFTNTLKEKRKIDIDNIISSNLSIESSHEKALKLENDLQESHREIDVVKSLNVGMQQEIKDLEKENKNLQQGLKEIFSSLKDGEGKSNVSVECPTLEKLLSLMEARSVGDYDTNTHLKSQLDVYAGRCEQLKSELKSSRQEHAKLVSQLERHKVRAENLEEQLKIVQQPSSPSSGSKEIALLSLPKGVSSSSASIIESLNSQLIQVLHEATGAHKIISELESKLEDQNRKYNVSKHQMGLLYEQHNNAKKIWTESEKLLENEVEKRKAVKECDMVKINEYERLLESLEQDESEVKRRIADTSRRITKLQIEEAILKRKCKLLEDGEILLRKENVKYQNDLSKMEKNVVERIGILTRMKDMSAFKINALQKMLENTVPRSDLLKANREYEVLCAKYRDVLENENKLVARTEHRKLYEIEVQRLEKENEFFKGEMEVKNEKIHNMEARLVDLDKQGIITEIGNIESESLAKRLATVEMKELNERQRANHVQNLYDQQKLVLNSLEQRNEELEAKFKELAKINLDLQDTERQIREKLSDCVSAEINCKNESRIGSLEKTSFGQKQEISKLKEIADIAQSQAEIVEMNNKLQHKEVSSLRNQILELQSESDEKALIGKLYRQLLNLQLSEGLAVNKMNKSLVKISKMEEACLKLEQICEEKNQEMYHIHQQSACKINFLNKIIHELRRQFSGAVPISKQEKFSQEMMRLQSDRILGEKALHDARNRESQAQDKLAELELRHKSLEELIVSLNAGDFPARILEWHKKLESLRVTELKSNRKINRLNQKVNHTQEIFTSQERLFEDLEAENVALSQKLEERELFWENREFELERSLRRFGKKDVPRSSSTVLEAKVSKKITPDHDGIINDNLIHLESKLKEYMEEIKSKDKVVRDLRIKVAGMVNIEARPTTESSGVEPNMAAQASISSLKMRLDQKEESVRKYEAMLKRANREYDEMNKRHSEELLNLHSVAQDKRESYLINFKQVIKEMSDAMNKEDVYKSGLSNKQLARMNELEDIVAEQENAMSNLADKLQKSRIEARNWEQKSNDVNVTLSQKISQLKEENLHNMCELEGKVQEKEAHLSEKISEIDKLQKDFEKHLHTPTVSQPLNPNPVKPMVDRLKNQLVEKERQLQSLSHALADLRTEMVNMAQENLLAKQVESDQAHNVHKIISLKTEELRKKIDELAREKAELLSQLSSEKREQNILTSEINSLNIEVKEQNKIIGSLKSSNTVKNEMPEMENLQFKAKSFQQQQEQIQPAEKPYENMPNLEKELRAHEDRVKWEQNKKWQKTVDRMKEKVKLKDEEVVVVQKQTKLLRDQLSRCQREKLALENKLKMPSSIKPGISLSGTNSKQSNEIQKLNDENEGLKAEMDQLKNEIKRLVKQESATQSEIFTELKARNQFLEQKLADAHRQLTRHQLKRKPVAEVPDVVVVMEEKLEKSQVEVVKLSEKNMELRFEVEQCRAEISRFKSRIIDLERIIRVLKAKEHKSQSSEDKKKIETLENEVESLKQAISNLENTNRNCSVTNSNDDINDLRCELNHNIDATNSLKSSLQFAQQEKEDLKTKLESSEFQIAELQIQCEPVRDANNENPSIASRIRENKVKKIEAELNKKSHQLDTTKALLKEASKRATNLETNLEDLKKSSITKQRIDGEGHESSQYSEIIMENKDLKSELEILTSTLDKKEAHINKLKRERKKEHRNTSDSKDKLDHHNRATLLKKKINHE